MARRYLNSETGVVDEKGILSGYEAPISWRPGGGGRRGDIWSLLDDMGKDAHYGMVGVYA